MGDDLIKKKSSDIGCMSLEFYYLRIPNIFQYERSWLRSPYQVRIKFERSVFFIAAALR